MAYVTIGSLRRLSQYMAGQLASAVAITGGTISGVTLTGTVTPTLPAAQTGTVTLNGATPVAVTKAAVTANSVIIFTLKTVGGTVGAYPAIQTITPTTGFTVSGTALDTSVYNYAIIN